MIMKRKATRIMALLLMLCLLLPQSAMAVTRRYLEMSITERTTPENIVSGTSGYLGGTESLTAEVVGFINENYNRAEGIGGLSVFQSPAMKAIMDAGLDAYGVGESAWNSWVVAFNTNVANANAASNTVDLKGKLADLNTKVNELTPNVTYSITYTPTNDQAPDGDPARGNMYTVSVRLVETTTSSGGSGSQTTQPDQPTQPVTSKPTEEGKVSVSTDKASKDEKVTINVTPDEGYVVNRVIVTDSEGNQIVITATGDNNTYTFEMPDDAVDVQVTFVREPVAPSETKVDTMLNTDADLAYLQGKEDNLFHPEQSITRGQVAIIFYRLLKDSNVEITKTFTDVPEGFWCEDAVNTLAALGIVKGISDEKFDPNKPITRAQFVAICARFAQAIAEGENFKDVSEDYWAYEYITTASGYGWINGVGNDLFAPDKPITRAQAATIVNRMLARIADRAEIDAGMQQYDDVPRTYWAWYDICEASTGVVPR